MALIPNASFEGELAGKQASLTEASLEIHLNARSHLGLTQHDHLYPPHLDIFFFHSGLLSSAIHQVLS